METTKKVVNSGISWMCLLFVISQNAMAQSKESTRTTFGLEDDTIGFAIIGIILGFGVISYIIISLIARYSKKDDSTNNIRPINHRHQHHHRIIKKSA